MEKLQPNKRYITVFCSATEVHPKYTEPAIQFARLMVKHGYHLVWGGSNTGLMEIIASEVQKLGGKIIGVSMDLFKDCEKTEADEMIIAKDLAERKSLMLERGHAVAVLVGGIGTLDEVTEVLPLKKLNLYNKPLVVLNTENFYEGLKLQLQKMRDEGFLTSVESMKNAGFFHNTLEEMIYFAEQPEEAIAYINKHLKKN